MRKWVLILLVLVVMAFVSSVWAQCPQDEWDFGVCDTMYIEAWPADVAAMTPGGGPFIVRVPIYLTCDVVDAADSIAGFVVPLCYEKKTNTSKYATVTAAHNNTNLWPFPGLDESIFRNIETTPGDSIFNWMMLQSYPPDFGNAWDTKILDLDDVSHFWLTMFPTGTQDHLFESGSRLLLVTVTFELEDTMTVCIDTCFWPPASRLGLQLIGHGNPTKFPRPAAGGTEGYESCFPGAGNDVREIGTAEESRPAEFSLSQNYPNPFNPYTNFRFALAKSAHVKIDIFNIVGQRVKTLVDEEMKAGVYAADWDGKDDRGKSVSSGVYFYRMQAGDFSDMKKMLLVK
jgi:hypothetical protein